MLEIEAFENKQSNKSSGLEQKKQRKFGVDFFPPFASPPGRGRNSSSTSSRALPRDPRALLLGGGNSSGMRSSSSAGERRQQQHPVAVAGTRR